jgi:hypothetical protein
MKERKINIMKLLTVFSITTLVFVSGLLLGQNLINSRITELEEMQEEIRIDLANIETEYALLIDNPCDLSRLDTLNTRLSELEPKMAYMEAKNVYESTSIKNLKKYYAILEVKHFLIVKEMNQQCEENLIPILYFYSNEKCNRCTDQGIVLDNLREDSDKRILTYSFDVDLDLSLIRTLQRMYDVSTVPTIVINERSYSGFRGRKEIERIIEL